MQDLVLRARRGEVVAAVLLHHHAVAQPLTREQLDAGLGERHVDRREGEGESDQTRQDEPPDPGVHRLWG